MAESTKDQIVAAARLRFATKAVPIDAAGSVTVTVRELPRPERDALDDRVLDKAADGTRLIKPNVHFVEEWLAITMTPAFTVGELLTADWPYSLKEKLFEEARAINGFTVAEAAKN